MRANKNLVAMLGLAASLVFVHSAVAAEPAPAAEQIERSVRTMLSGYELVPTPAMWQKAGPAPQVAAALMKLADTPDRRVLALRATASLAHFPRVEVREFLTARIADSRRDVRLRGRSLMALGVGFKEAAAPVVVPYLATPDPQLREDAIRALRPMATPVVETLLRARTALEPLAHLRTSLAASADRVAQNRARLIAAQQPVPAVAKLVDPGPVRLEQHP